MRTYVRLPDLVVTRPPGVVSSAVGLLEKGLSVTEVAGLLHLPRTTVRDWSQGRRPKHEPYRSAVSSVDSLAGGAYCYLLGLYLGDGHITRAPRTYCLRLSLDAQYPSIAIEARLAIDIVKLDGADSALHTRRDCSCVVVSSYWSEWPVLLPQHGAGRKHDRKIALEPWQQAWIRRHPEELVRGMIHSDGCRYIARERRSDGGWYEWPRYGFSNRSQDIRRIFCDALDLLGLAWRAANNKDIYVNRRAAVAALDQFVGSKR